MHEFVARQKALGLTVEENQFGITTEKVSFVTEKTMNELNETKYKLAKLMQNKNEVKKLTQVWLRMMVDYWESKRLMEQTFGEYQQIVHGAYALKEEKTEQI